MLVLNNTYIHTYIYIYKIHNARPSGNSTVVEKYVYKLEYRNFHNAPFYNYNTANAKTFYAVQQCNIRFLIAGCEYVTKLPRK